MQYWVSRYAKNQVIKPLEDCKLLRNINTKHWELTLEQFEAKARACGRESELDTEYFKSRVAQSQDLERQLQQTAMPYAKDTQASLSNALVEQYDETYMRTTFNIQAQKAKFTSNFARFNDNQMKIVVSMPWVKDGKDFSSRVWKDYTKDLPSYLMDSMLRGTLMGYSPQRVSKMFHARFQDAKRNDIHRLVVTEMAHIAEEATAKSYEENEIDWYEYMATLESHTCTICAHLDGFRFKVSERKPGINYPTIHSRYRCTTIPWIEDLPDVKERWMRDPETGKGRLIRNVKFDEWRKMMNSDSANNIIGVRTKDGIAINGVSQHLVERTLERSVTTHEMIDALARPLHIFDPKIVEDGQRSIRYLGKAATVVVNPDTGNVVTTHKTDKRRRRRWSHEPDD